MGMAKQKKQNNFIVALVKHRKAILITTSVLVVLYIIGLINPITGPALRYPYYEAYCGKKPIIGSSFMWESYVTPEMEAYKDEPLGLYTEFFCTENEAMSQGFGRSLES